MKYLIILGLLVTPFVTRAAVPDGTYFFDNGQGYDVNGTQTFFCLGIVSQTCYTVEGEYAFVRELVAKIDQLNQKIDQLQNTINNLPTTPQIIYVPTPTPVAPADITAPKVVFADEAYVYNHGYYGYSDAISGFQSIGPCNGKCYIIVTNEPVVANFYFYKVSDFALPGLNGDAIRLKILESFNQKSGELLTYSDSVLRQWHHLDLSAILEKGVNYSFRVELTDAAGNLKVGEDFYSNDLFW